MYTLSTLIQGFPGRSPGQGNLGWSSVTLLARGRERYVVDTGSFGVRPVLLERLRALGVEPTDVTGVLLTHAHWDHMVNWTLFPRAQVVIGRRELQWAAQSRSIHLPEAYVERLCACTRLRLTEDGEEVFPGIVAHATFGHTPGHMAFEAAGAQGPILLIGDAAKNRVELLTCELSAPEDPDEAQRSVAALWRLWRQVGGGLLVPGHDAALRLVDGRPALAQDRRQEIQAWLGDTVAQVRRFPLS